MRTVIIAACIFLYNAEATGQMANGKCKFLGNIIGGSAPSSFQTYWNQVTPENAGKWGSVESSRDVMNWSQLDIAYNYAKSNGFAFKQHTFVWNNQQPAWLSGLSTTEIKEEVEEWMTLYSQRYPNTDFIDVVNEPLNAPASYKNALGGSGNSGYDWIVWSFEKARTLCPNAKLLLNEYNVINNNATTDQYLAIINVLKARNLIDGIGVQGHYFELGNATSSLLTANLNKLMATGLPIYISEFDVNVLNDTDQRTKFEQLFSLLWEHPGVRGITLWGYIQGQMWQADAYLLRTNQTERPALQWLKQYLSAADDDGCSITAVEETSDADISLSPNPAKANAITVRSNSSIREISVTDLSGLKLTTQRPDNVSEYVITIKLTAGIY